MKRMLALVIAVAAVAAPRAALAETALIDDLHDATGWWSYAVELDGSRMSYSIQSLEFAFPAHVGLILYDARDQGIFALTVTSTGPTEGATVHVGAVPGSPIQYDASRQVFAGGEGGPSVGFEVPAGIGGRYEGVNKVLFWSAGGVKRARITVATDGASQIVGADTGADTFLYTSRDFTGAATVVGGGTLVTGVLPQFATSARANVLTARAVAVENTLVGLFIPAFANPVPGGPAGAPFSNNVMSVDMADGRRSDCPCILTSFVADGGGVPAGPGRYTFNLTGAGVVGGAGEVILGGADARLP